MFESNDSSIFDPTVESDSGADGARDALTEILQAVDQTMLAAAIGQEATGYVTERAGLLDEDAAANSEFERGKELPLTYQLSTISGTSSAIGRAFRTPRLSEASAGCWQWFAV